MRVIEMRIIVMRDIEVLVIVMRDIEVRYRRVGLKRAVRKRDQASCPHPR